MFWGPLLDRIGPQAHSDGLERSLARVGLATHPKVLLVVEGDTELLQVGALLNEMDIGRDSQVRLIKQGTSSDWPNQFAQYVAPRLGRVRGGHHLIEAGPTALIVAMDPEERWATPESRDRERNRLQAIVRAEVRAQGGDVTQTELDMLVQVRSWGDHTYELANFSDDELQAALGELAPPQEAGATNSVDWRHALRASIEYARDRKLDVKVVFDRMQWPVRKMALAQLLLPVVVAKLHGGHDGEHHHAPVIDLVLDVQALVQRLSGGGFRLETPAQVVDPSLVERS